MFFKRFSALSQAALCALTLAACGGDPLDLSLEVIREIRVSIPVSLDDRGVTPGRYYSVDVDVVIEDEDGQPKVIKDPESSQIVIQGEGFSRYGDRIWIDVSNLKFWKSGYDVSVSVEGNHFPAKVVHLAPHLAPFNALAYYGSSGGTGGDGSRGPDVRVTAARALGDGQDLHLLRVEHAGLTDWVVAPYAPFAVSSVGGSGGNGSDGSDGRSGSDGYCSDEDDSDSGGNGGDGGDGGNGGDVTLVYSSAKPRPDVRIASYGGSGGSGGEGGNGGSGGTGCGGGSDGWSGSDGSDGWSGSDGYPGFTYFEPVSQSRIDAAFESQDLAALGLTMVR